MNYVILKFIGLVTIQANKLVEAVLVGTDQIITARRYASAVLGVVILSVRLSVTRVTNSKNLPAIFFLYHMKGNPSGFLPPNSGWWATSPST